MKKTTLYLAMAALMLASCSKNEVSEGNMPTANDPNQINFNSSTGISRATSNGLTQVQDGFNVLGFKNGSTTPFINGKDNEATYKYTASTWGWIDATGKNWPDVAGDYPLTFYAEFPKVADMSLNTNLNKDIALDLDITKQVDYLVAKAEVASRPTSGFAPLAFKHILSNLVFKIETTVGYTVHVQSIRVVNTAKAGRTFDYATMSYKDAEPAPYTELAATDGTYNTAEGFYYYANNSVAATPWSFTAAAGTTAGEVTITGIMMQMPQKTLNYWIKANDVNGLGKFEVDAKNWKNNSGTLDSWFTAASTETPAGMKGSKGWEGSRIEVIYRVYDGVNGKSIIGRQSGEAKAGGGNYDRDQYIRVGFPLDLAANAPVNNGWEMSKRYTYTIQLGSPSASNGILLDPDYKDASGSSESPKTPVDNPTTNPGEPVTPGLINFNVSVDEWAGNNNEVGIK